MNENQNEKKRTLRIKEKTYLEIVNISKIENKSITEVLNDMLLIGLENKANNINPVIKNYFERNNKIQQEIAFQLNKKIDELPDRFYDAIEYLL